ncbi:MAG TPA: hypothetical protein PL045_05095 [Chitinophagaceae bacterium]|nr:hypothetical protein [Chitinophagaceae bacterium]
MKKQSVLQFITAANICLLFCTSVFSQSDSSHATIILIGDVRTHDKTQSAGDNLLDDMLTHANVFMDTILLCKLSEQRYSQHIVPSGEYTFSAQPGRSGKNKSKHYEGIRVTIEAGRTYYFQVYAKERDVYLVKVSEDFGQKVIANIKPAAKCD